MNRAFMNSDNKEIEVKDIWAAAYLHALGKSLLGIRREGRVVYFQFNQDTKDKLLEFTNNKQIPIITYRNSLSALKNYIFDIRLEDSVEE